MELGFALDELRATGWTALDSTGCAYDRDGRAFPGVQRVMDEFAAAGVELKIQRIEKFQCWRAEWKTHEPAGTDDRGGGAVVSHSREEAAVFALAQLRRSLVTA